MIVAIEGSVYESCILCLPSEDDGTDRTVTLLRDDDLRLMRMLRIFIIVLITIQEHHDIGILLDRTGLSQVGQHRTMIRTLLYRSRQLGKGDNRTLHLSCNRLQGTGDLRDLLLTALAATSATGHELEVVDDDEVESLFELLLTALGAELSDRNTRCIIDGDICICDTVDGIDQLAPVLIREGTLTELICIDERLHREHTVDELLPAHFE